MNWTLQCGLHKTLIVDLWIFQTYKSDLAQFRNTVLPREISRQYRENPETNVIQTNLSDMNDRYTQLKTDSTKFLTHLTDVADRQKRYHKAEGYIDSWLTNARSSLDQMMREPVAAEPADIQRQIDNLKVWLKSSHSLIISDGFE